MALCWGRHFRSFSSSGIFGRRTSQSVSLHHKRRISPLLQQMTVREPYRTGVDEFISRLSTSSMFHAQECKAYKEVKGDPDNYPGKPEKSQLKRVSQVLVEDLPYIFSRVPNYSIYHSNIVLENNIRGTKTTGILNLTLELLTIRLLAHFKFSSVTLKLLKITEHVEDGTVRVRWRAEGVPFYTVLIRPFKAQSSKISWYDGFSTYYVHSDGLVHKLTMDKMMPDSEEKVSSSLKSELAAKVAFAIGISLKDLSVPLICCHEVQEQSNFFKSEYSLRVNRTCSKTSLNCNFKMLSEYLVKL